MRESDIGATPRAARFDPAAFLNAESRERAVATYPKGRVIFSQGDPADAVFYIQTGSVKVSVVSRQGKEAVVAMLGPGELMGEGCLNGQQRRLGTALAMSECVTLQIPKAEIQRLLEMNPMFSRYFIAHILTRN